MYIIDNKFEIGEECYTVYRKPIHYTCPICEGSGKFLHNGYEVWCKNCSGSGKLHNAHQFVMDVCTVKVRRIITSIFNSEITIKYRIDVIDDSRARINSRSETTMFKTLDEAAQYCADVNTKKVTSEF